MICDKCKKQISDDSFFCSYCGEKVRREYYGIAHELAESAQRLGFIMGLIWALCDKKQFKKIESFLLKQNPDLFNEYMQVKNNCLDFLIKKIEKPKKQV